MTQGQGRAFDAHRPRTQAPDREREIGVAATEAEVVRAVIELEREQLDDRRNGIVRRWKESGFHEG